MLGPGSREKTAPNFFRRCLIRWRHRGATRVARRRIIGGLSAPCRATRIFGCYRNVFGWMALRTSSIPTVLHRIDSASHNTKSRAGRQAAVAPSGERRRHHLTVAAAAVRPWKGPGWPGEGLVSAASIQVAAILRHTDNDLQNRSSISSPVMATD